MNENVKSRSAWIAKWLRAVMYVAIASMANSVISYIPVVPAVITTWVSRGIMVAMVVCMFQLGPVNQRYKKAAVTRLGMLLSTLITSFLTGSTALTLVALILSVIAVYQEYHAHSELIAQMDPKLSGKWHSLFYWEFVAVFLFSLCVSIVLAVTLVIVGMEADGVSRLSAVITGIVNICELVVDVMYLLYLKKTIGYFREDPVQDNLL